MQPRVKRRRMRLHVKQQLMQPPATAGVTALARRARQVTARGAAHLARNRPMDPRRRAARATIRL
jgi:hypothetical protein